MCWTSVAISTTSEGFSSASTTRTGRWMRSSQPMDSRSTISPGDVHMREGVDGRYLEFSTYKDVPYELRAATEAVWDHFKGVEKHLGVGKIYEKAAKVRNR